jgi:hypothetical protein
MIKSGLERPVAQKLHTAVCRGAEGIVGLNVMGPGQQWASSSNIIVHMGSSVVNVGAKACAWAQIA